MNEINQNVKNGRDSVYQNSYIYNKMFENGKPHGQWIEVTGKPSEVWFGTGNNCNK